MKTKKEILIEELQQLRSTTFHIMDLIYQIEQTEDGKINDRIAIDYPFDKSFDEVHADIDNWVETQKKVIKGIDKKM